MNEIAKRHFTRGRQAKVWINDHEQAYRSVCEFDEQQWPCDVVQTLDAIAALRPFIRHAGFCAADEAGGSEHCICGATEAIIKADEWRRT